jgi:hypothetical protein
MRMARLPLLGLWSFRVFSVFRGCSLPTSVYGFAALVCFCDFSFPWPAKSSLACGIALLFQQALACGIYSLFHWAAYFTGLLSQSSRFQLSACVF